MCTASLAMNLAKLKKHLPRWQVGLVTERLAQQRRLAAK